MAVKPFSKEQLNFFKFSTLVLDEFPKVLRQVFITMWNSKIAVKPGFIVWDDSTTVRNMLLSCEGGKTEIPTAKSIEEWDCTALFKATIYAKTFGVPSGKGISTLNDLYLKKSKPVPGSFHPSVQSSTGIQEQTYALAIDQLRLLRNTLCHSPKPEIVKSDFDNYVQLVKDALSAVNVDTAFVDVVGEMSESDFPTEKVQQLSECRVKELQDISMLHENMEQKLSSIDEQTKEIREMMGNISMGKNRNAPDSLPKPHIPSVVPMFTGREDEIEEITNLITDQSTRVLNIWGSPGFGKTSTAIAVARHLSCCGYPVYFFKLQGVASEGEFLSQISSIFKSNVVDLSLTALDRLVSIFREITSPIYLVFDNLDDFLSHVTHAEEKLFRTFDKILDSSIGINILFTTRELLEGICDEVEGFQDVRIRPLSPVSSVEFVRKLIPSFSENIVVQVVAICSHVALAMKLVASLVKNNSEEMANEILAELEFPENLSKQLETNMLKLFNIPFEQLALGDKHALISLTVFSSATISKDAAMYVVSGEMQGSKSNAAGSLKTLVAKSLIDEDLNENCYSIHPLIYSFVVDKAKRNDFENVLNSSRILLWKYYLCLFEKLNDDFLAGKSLDVPQLQETLRYLSNAMFQSITGSLETSHDVFRILSKSEIFLFSINIPFVASHNIHKLYDLAIEKCSTCNNIAYLKLYVSKYFQTISFSLFVSPTNADIPEDIRKEIMLLSDGTAAKLCCYEGILQFHKGDKKSGIQVIEKHLEGLQKCADQQLIKCLCLQLLVLFYTDLKECKKSSNFSRKAIQLCDEIGNNNLFLIGDRDQTVTGRDDEGEALLLFVHLLLMWSATSSTAETIRFLLSYAYGLQQQKENEVFDSLYLQRILAYGDGLLAVLDVSTGEKSFMNEKIDFLDKSLKSSNKCTSSKERTLLSIPKKYLPERLLTCYSIKSVVYSVSEQGLSIEECRNALDICLQRHGKVHKETAYWCVKMGFALCYAEDCTSALQSFDQAHEIMKVCNDGSSSSQDIDIIADMYNGKGKTYQLLFKFQSAVASFEEALRLKRKVHEETEEISNILVSLGLSQQCCNDLYLALANVKQALQIFVKLYNVKSNSRLGSDVVNCYQVMGNVYFRLGNNTEGRKCFETALNFSQKLQDCAQRSLLAQGMMCLKLSCFEEGENRYKKLFDRLLPTFKEHHEFLLPIMYLEVGSKQLDSKRYQAGREYVRKALDIQLDVTLEANVLIREATVIHYIVVVMSLLEIEKVGLARKAIDRAFKIAESLPEGRRHLWMHRCYYWKGCIYNATREYVSAIESLERSLHHLVSSCDDFDKKEEFHWKCHLEIASAHFFLGAYKDALTSLYELLSILKRIFPEGSEDEAQTYVFIAKIAEKINNKSLVVSNLRLAYKMYSKVLGKNHPSTEQSYVEYASALIR